MALHLNIEDLLSVRTVESERVEYKQGWNPDAIYRSICAFANDFDNIGGGYIVIGVKEDETTRTAQRPVEGLSTHELTVIQQKMIGFNNLLNPVYNPHLFVETVDEKYIVVIWVPGGPNRPYQVPEVITAREKRYFYYIRKYANSVKANLEEQQELIALANQVPFDDRPNTQATPDKISMLLLKDYLQKVGSRLADQVGKLPDSELLQQMELISGPNEHIFPRNVGLMLFAEKPESFFPYTQVEIVEFPDGDAGVFYEQAPITGPVTRQIERTLHFLKDKLVKEKVLKPAHKAESIRIYSYPYQAIEEIVVNAFYHRDYQQREPIEIRIYANSVIFINQGGPDRSIRIEAFNQGQVRSRRYRNRRLGEFLKELELTEGRATGIPTILKALKDNGSPEPRFFTDENHSFFEIELFIHPAFTVKMPFSPDVSSIKWDLHGIDTILNQLIEHSADIVGGIAETHQELDNQADEMISTIDSGIVGGIAGGIAEIHQEIDNQADEIINTIDSGIAGGIADGIAGVMNKNFKLVLILASKPVTRAAILEGLQLSNRPKNFETYIQPLVAINWLTMTIPHKPTSPNQKYLTTLKGRLILKFLKKQ